MPLMTRSELRWVDKNSFSNAICQLIEVIEVIGVMRSLGTLKWTVRGVCAIPLDWRVRTRLANRKMTIKALVKRIVNLFWSFQFLKFLFLRNACSAILNKKREWKDTTELARQESVGRDARKTKPLKLCIIRAFRFECLENLPSLLRRETPCRPGLFRTRIHFEPNRTLISILSCGFDSFNLNFCTGWRSTIGSLIYPRTRWI